MMRALVFGALLGLLVVVFGLPLAVPSTVMTAAVAQPVTLAFAAGLAARPYLHHRRWSR